MSVDLSEIRDERLVAELKTRGWRCVKDDEREWEKPMEFARRHGIAPSSFCRLLKRNDGIPGLEFDRAKGGRVRYVRSSPATENWLKSHLQQRVNRPQQPVKIAPINGSKPEITDFDRFWAAYPRHVGKIDAQKAWVAMKCEPLTDRILVSLSKCVKSVAWTKERGQFIPHPATWLRRGGWDDEMELLHRHGTLEEKDMPKVIRYG